MSTIVACDCDAVITTAATHAPLPVSLRFDPADPFAVHLVFPGTDPDGDVTWSFARALLEDGLTGPTGHGDVRVSPVDGEERLRVHLSSPDGAAVVDLNWDDVARFVDATLNTVPAGTEHIDWDHVISDLLDTDRP